MLRQGPWLGRRSWPTRRRLKSPVRSLLFLFIAGVACAQIVPQTAQLQAGQSQQFTVAWPTPPSGPAVWSMPFGGVGTLTQSGLYTAPATVSKAGFIIIQVSAPGTTQTYSASVNIAKPAVVPATWVYQEIPTGGMDTMLTGSGFYVQLRCTPVSRTIHLWLSGALLYEGKPDLTGGAYYLATGKRLAGININLENCNTGAFCADVRVDYQTTDVTCGGSPVATLWRLKCSHKTATADCTGLELWTLSLVDGTHLGPVVTVPATAAQIASTVWVP